MQEFEAHHSSNKNDGTQENEGMKQALQVNTRTMNCWYYNNKWHKKTYCNKPKADLRRRRDDENEEVVAHVARTVMSTTALIDSGPTFQIARDSYLLIDRHEHSTTTVHTASNKTSRPSFSGWCLIGWCCVNHMIHINRVLYVPEFAANLVSVSQICDVWYTVEFNKKNLIIKKDGQAFSIGKHIENVYVMTLEKIEQANVATEGATYSDVLDLCHHRMGHADKKSISRMTETTKRTRYKSARESWKWRFWALPGR